ncbi:hypothetical protein B5807_10853 [Epicoccum nigrum]|uniref:Uncharacterized protein n=1 Tax=Epicoccum nigrum TaxID=105696 RepID=A0A1Y2LNM5_EPING|nr:hypothetical protein B5807_10853 [Epicoccum nigrum]
MYHTITSDSQYTQLQSSLLPTQPALLPLDESLLHRLHLLHHPRRLAHGNTKLGHILSHHAHGPNRTPPANRHPGEDNHVPADPAIIPDHHGPAVLDILAAALHGALVRGGEDTHIGAEHAAIAYGDEAAVEDGQVEVCVEALTEGDVAAVVDVEGGLDEHPVVAQAADDGLEQLQALRGENVKPLVWVRRRRVREPRVVSVHRGAGEEAGAVQLRGEGGVADGVFVSLSLRWKKNGLGVSFPYSIPEIIFSYSSHQGTWLRARAFSISWPFFCVAAILSDMESGS